MNKKGFTLMEVLTVIVVITLIMMIVLPTLGNINKNNNEELYKTYEKMVVEYALASPLKGQEVIKLSELKELKKVNDECDGYAYLESSNPITYKAYIKCGNNPPTDGYNETLAG